MSGVHKTYAHYCSPPALPVPGMYLQYKYGDLVNIDLNSAARRTLKDPEIDAWQALHRKISQHAFADLIAISEELTRTYPGLFTQ